MWKLLFFIFFQGAWGRRPLVRRQTVEMESVKFNFMPSLQKERDYQGLTLNVLNMLEEEEVSVRKQTLNSQNSRDADSINFPSHSIPALSLSPVPRFLPALSSVDCLSAEIPLKVQPKPVRKWVSKWSQHCKKPRGQFRYPDDCHAYIDCWDGRGKKMNCFPRNLVFNEAKGQCDWPSSTPCVLGDIGSEENNKKEVDVDLPHCSSYTGLGYKCVNFWECSDKNEILDDSEGAYTEFGIDARMVPPPKKIVFKGIFDPLSKKCPNTFEICCKGKCSDLEEKSSPSNIPPGRTLDTSHSTTLCPADYTGLRPIPGICTQFAECYKGTAIIKDCPPGLHFCIHSLMCDWPSKVVCDQLSFISKATSSNSKQLQNDEPRISGNSPTSRIDIEMMARKTQLIPAPPSGQKARLREGRTPSEGYLQLFHEDKWGYVCDKSGWTMEKANIVCKQLGFHRGVRKTTQGFVHGQVDESKKLTDHVECAGSEEKIQQCKVSYFVSGKPCKLSEDIVSITCFPDSWAKCYENEIPWKSSCYSFFPNASSFHEAQEHCKSTGRVLVEVDSQAENDMISELLFQNSRVTDIMNEVWTGGVGSNVARKNVWFWHSDTDKPMEFRNFWKGWSGGDRSATEIKDNFAYGIKMSRQFPLRTGTAKKNQLTDYYFWNLESFDTKLSYICERQQIDIGCMEGEGLEYYGNARRTQSGEFCKSWQSPEIGFWFDQAEIQKLGPLQNNNFCRNPDEAEVPWCLIKEGQYEDCDIPKCETGPIYPVNKANSCGSDQFQCQPGECIFSGYVCDGEYDCKNRMDENPHADCESYSEHFKSVSGSKLNVKEIERWTNRNLEACLRSCDLSKEFICRGVNYNMKEKSCILLDENVGMSGALNQDLDWSYFERIETQTLCDEELRCSSGKCFNKTQLCDGKFDCEDRKDEEGCEVSPKLKIRLRGGNAPNEGRVEIKAFDYGWGGICDDGFGINNAQVICKEAGFPLGAQEAVLHSRWGPGNEILLDELKCEGTESSILECKFNPWKEHDCAPKEYAGVVCKVKDDSCTEEEWKCQSGECINLEFLCDTTSDCSDGSDELAEYCQKPIEVRLVDGNNVTSGRVEVMYKGVWGTICDDNFDKEEGTILCKMLGFPGGVNIHKEGTFGPGRGPIWINNILCNGNETSLDKCPSPPWGPSYQCKHLEDVGIECLLNSFQTIETNKPSSSLQPNDFQCGVAEVEFKPGPPIAKVAGGQTSVHGSQPWTASIRVRGNTRSFHWCGAVLIGEVHILTAAHCVEDYPKDVYAVRVGDWDQDAPDVGEQEFSIQTVDFHPEFNVGAYLNNDIAVITLKLQNGKGVQFNDKVVPACLPSSSTTYNAGMECSISGWGSLGQNSGGYSRRLQSALVPILPTSECLKKHVYGADKLTGGMFCAGFLEGGIDSCQGDSGGPMVCQKRSKNELLGIISWGYGCGRPNKPGVYTRVANYVDWIKSIIGS